MRDKIKWFWNYYRNYPHVLVILLVMTPIQVALTVTIPRLIGFTIDYLKTGEIPSHWLAQWLSGLGEGYNLGPTESFGIGFMVLGLVSHIMYAVSYTHLTLPTN